MNDPSSLAQALDTMNNSGLLFTWKNMGHKVKVLNALNNSRLYLTWTILVCKLKNLDGMNNLGL